MTLSPGSGSTSRPEYRVTARSNVPQKKCTGVVRPRNLRSMLLHHHVDHREHAMKALRLLGVVGGMGAVLGKGNRIRHL